MTRSVAFCRNLNLGHRNSPSRAQLLEAFAGAGAVEATSFQVNGTVIFDGEEPVAVAERAGALLTPLCGYADKVVVRPAEWVRGLDLAEAGQRAEVSLFDLGTDFPEPLPWRPARGGLVVLRADRLHAVCANDADRTSGGTYVLERLLGVPVTSRGVPTMERLATRLRG